MRTLELDDLSKEEALAVVKVLDTIVGQDDNVQIKQNGNLLYNVAKNRQTALPSPDNEQYVPQPNERPSDVLERIFAEGSLLDERYQKMSFEEFRREAWGERGVR
ncbi:MAG: hypothetical protein WA958_05140 [Tunicatimonas sp.]